MSVAHHHTQTIYRSTLFQREVRIYNIYVPKTNLRKEIKKKSANKKNSVDENFQSFYSITTEHDTITVFFSQLNTCIPRQLLGNFCSWVDISYTSALPLFLN
jgi:hypothetical protein